MTTEAPPSVRTLTLNTTLAMVGATLATLVLHESSHAIAAIAQGSPARLFPFASVAVRERTVTEQIVEMMTGPAFSLALGLVLIAVLRPGSRPGFGHLWLTWLGFTSAMEGIGYLILTPLGVGDTGMSAVLVGLSPVLSWAAAALSIGGMVLLARAYGRRIARFVPHGDTPRLRGLSFYPWMIGTVVVVSLTLLWVGLSDIVLDPGSLFAVVMGAVALGVWAPMAMPFTAGVPVAVAGDRPIQLPRVAWAGVAALVILLVIDAVLTRGPQLG